MAVIPTAEVRVKTVTDRASLRRTEAEITKSLKRVEQLASKGGLLSKSYTQPLGKITGAVGEFEKSLEASNARVIAFGASAGIIYNVSRAIEAMTRSAIDLEHKLAEINVILNASQANLTKFGDALFDVAKNTGQTFNDVSNAALEFARQGLAMEETLKRTSDAMILVRLAGLDVQSSVEAVTATINSFNQTIISSTELVNKLANVDAAFAVSSADLAKAISRVGSSAQDAGVGLDQLIAMTTTAQQVTARGGAVIGNSLKTIFTRIQRPAVISNLEAFGVAVRDAQGATLPAIQVLKNFADQYQNMGAQQRAVAAEMVGGVFQVNVLKAAIGDLGKQFSIYDRALDTSVSSTDEAIQRNAALNKSLKTLTNETMVNLLKVGAKVGEITIAPTLRNALESVNKTLEDMQENADAEKLGSKMGKGVLEGIGNILKGPGMVVLGALVGKLFYSFSKFSSDAIRTFAGWNEGAQKQAEMQQLIQNILLKNPDLINAAASSEQNMLNIENKILEVIRGRNIALSQSAELSAKMARNLSAADLQSINMAIDSGGRTEGSWRPVEASKGLVPNFVAPAAAAGEAAGAISGGYTPGNIRQMSVQGVGKVTYNTAETVKKFKGMSQPAIMPPERSDAGKTYKGKFQDKHGFNPYAAHGFIPNFRPSVIDVKARKYHKGDWSKASVSEKDLAMAKYLQSAIDKLDQAKNPTASISNWRTNEGISQGAVTNWIKDRANKNPKGALANLGPLSEAKAKVLVPIIKKHQSENLGKNIKEGNKFEDQLMEYFGIGVGTKGARNVSFDFVGPSTIPSTKDALDLKRKISMKAQTDVGDAHVGAGHSDGLFLAKFLRHRTGHAQGQDAPHAASIAEAFYPSDKRKKGLNLMDVERQYGDGKTYTDILGGGPDRQMRRTPTVWSVARDHWANLKTELLLRSNENQIKKDKKKFSFKWDHDGINMAALQGKAFDGMIPNFATKILDKDQLAQNLGVPLASREAKKVFESIVKQAAQRGQINETIVGTAGIGKTTEAIKRAGGPNFVVDPTDLDPSDRLVVVRAAQTVVDSPEFTKAGKITFLKGAREVVEGMRKKRSGEIKSGTSKTGFGRDANQKFGSTSGVVTEALLAEKYASKLSVFERQADMSLREAAEFEKLNEIKGATATIGAFAPFTSGHSDMAEQAGASVAFVSKGAGREYDIGLSPREKAKLIELANPNIMAVPSSAGIQEHFEHGGKAYRMKKADTKVALGADRVSGGEADLTNRFSKDYAGVVPVAGRLGGVSGTKIRKAVVDGDLRTLEANLPPKVFETIKKNIPTLQKRAAYIQDRKDKAAKGMAVLEEDFAKFKAKYGNKRKGELSEITQAREMFKEKRKALKARQSGYGGKAWGRLGLNLNLASEGLIPNLAYKGLHEKDYGTTMVGRKGAMGANLSDEQVQKMTAGMRMIRGPEGETLVVATDMKGRSGRMIATGLTARKIKKAGPAWRTMLNEVPHLFDGLAYDLVGGVAGANWDPEGATGAMAGVKFENEMAASLGEAKPGAKKGSDFVIGEKIAANLKTQKNIQAKLALHERSKRDKTKVVDIASSFSKYLVDILSHNIKTHGLSSVTTPDRFQQAMTVLNQNPAVKKDWAKTFGPMGMQSMGLVPNFARTWDTQTKGKHGKFRDGKSSPAKGSPGIWKTKRVSHSKFKAGGFKGFGGFVPNFYFAEADAYQQFGQSLEDKKREDLLRLRGKATWDQGMGMDFGDAESATSGALEAEINPARVAASQGKALRAMGVPEYLSTYGTGAVKIPPPGSVSFNTADQTQRDRLKDKYGITSDERPTFNAVFNEEDARRNVARRKMAMKKNMTGRQFKDTFSGREGSKKALVLDNSTESLREQRNVTKDEIKSEIHTSAGALAAQYGFWGGVFPKNSNQSRWYNSLESVFKNAHPDANRILITSTEAFVKNKGLANKGIDGTTQVNPLEGTGLSHELIARSNPTLNELESVDFNVLGGNVAGGLSQLDMGMLNKTGEFGKYASDKETIKAYTAGLEKMVINTLGAKAFTTVLDQAKMDRFTQMRGKMDSSTLRSFGTFARGLVPNFAEDALKAAIGREKAAGQGQPKVGYDSRLKSSGGIGVYNTSEGSLSNAINMHLASGNSITGIQSQGASQGLVPNFASDSLDTAMLMGSLSMMAFSLKDIGQAGKALLQSTEGTADEILALEKKEKEAREAMIAGVEAATKALQEKESEIKSPTLDKAEADFNEYSGAAESSAEEREARRGEYDASRVDRWRAREAEGDARDETTRAHAERARTLKSDIPLENATRGNRMLIAKRAGYKGDEDGVQQWLASSEGIAATGGKDAKGRNENLNKLDEMNQKSLKQLHDRLDERVRVADENLAAAREELEARNQAADVAREGLEAAKDKADADAEMASLAEDNLKEEKNKHKGKVKKGTKAERDAKAQAIREGRAETRAAEARTKGAKGKRGLGARAMGFVEGGGAMAMMTSGPMIGGVASQFLGKDDLAGKAKAEGIGNAVGMLGTGVQMGQAFGPKGMVVGAALGAIAGGVMALDNVKKAKIAEKMEEVGKRAEEMGTKLNSVTAGGQAYMDSLDKLDKMMKDQSGNVTADDLAKVRSKMTEALAEVPQEFQARFKAAAGDAEKIKEIFGEITQDLQKSKADLDAAKMGYEMQKEFGSGARGMSFWSADTTMFEKTAGGGNLSAEGKRVQASMKQAIGMALNKQDLEKAIDSGMNVDFSKMANMQKFTGEGFGAMLENLQGKVDDSDIQHIGKLMQDVFDRMKSGAKISAQATRELQKKNALDKIAVQQQKALNRAIEDFNTIVGKSVKGIQDRLITIAQLTDKVKEFTIDLAQEDLKGARQLEDPFMSKEIKVRAELIDKSFEIKTASLIQFRKAVSDGTKRNLEVFVKKFTDLNQKVIKQTAGLAEKSGKEQLGELARNRKAQEAMIPVIEEAFKVWATAPKDINAMKAVTAKTAQILKNNRISENNAENAAKLLLEEIKQSGMTTVNELALAVQQRNQQLEIAERQAYWAERSVHLQERIASFGGQGEIFGDAGMAGLSKSFEGMANVLGAQIKGAVSTSIVDVGRANAQLLDQLINKMNFDQLREIGPGIAPLLSSAIAGRTEDINRQVGFARRVSGIVAPSMQLPDVDAEKVATEQIAAQLKLNQMPDDIAEIRKNSEILNRLVALQTNTLVGANEGAFDDALKLNGIPTNMKAAALGTQVTARATDSVRRAVKENVLKSGYQVGQRVGKVRMTNELGFENLLGASAEFQTLAANIPAEFAKANGLAMGVGLDSLQTALTNSMGQIGTNVAEALRNFRDPIEELNEATKAQKDINIGNRLIREKDIAAEALKAAKVRQGELAEARGRTPTRGVAKIDYAKEFGIKYGDAHAKYAGQSDVHAKPFIKGALDFQNLADYVENAAIIMGNVSATDGYSGHDTRIRKMRQDNDEMRNSIRKRLGMEVAKGGFGINKESLGSEQAVQDLMKKIIDMIDTRMDWSTGGTSWLKPSALITGEGNLTAKEQKSLRTEINDLMEETQKTHRDILDEESRAISKNVEGYEKTIKALDTFNKKLEETPWDGLAVEMQSEWLGVEGKRFKTEAEARKTYQATEKGRKQLAEGQGPQRIQFMATVTKEQQIERKRKELREEANKTLFSSLNQLMPSGWKESAAVDRGVWVQNYEDQLSKRLSKEEQFQTKKEALEEKRRKKQDELHTVSMEGNPLRANRFPLEQRLEDLRDDGNMYGRSWENAVNAANANEEALRENLKRVETLREELKVIKEGQAAHEGTRTAAISAADSIKQLRGELQQLTELKDKILPKDPPKPKAKDSDKTTPNTPTDTIKESLAKIETAIKNGNVESLSAENRTLLAQAKNAVRNEESLDSSAKLTEAQLELVNKKLEELIKKRRGETAPTDPTVPKKGDPAFKPTEGIDGIKPKDVGYSPQSESNQAIARAEVFMNTIKQREDLSLEQIKTATGKLENNLKNINEGIESIPSFEDFAASNVATDPYGDAVSPLLEDQEKAYADSHDAQRRKLELTRDALLVELEALGLLDDQKTLEKERLQLLKDLALKNIDINKSLGEANQDTSKIRRLVDAFGDLQRDIAQDNVIKALAEAHKSRVTGGKTADALGKSGIDAALFGAIGETPGKAAASARDASVLTEIRNRRRTNLQSGGGTNLVSDWYTGLMDANDNLELGDQDDRLEKLGLLKGGARLSSEELKKWVASNQDNLMSILNDPALKPEQYEDVINAIRKLFNVMTEEEAIRISLTNTYQRTNDAFQHQLDLYEKGLSSYDKLNSSFQSLKKAAQDAGKMLDQDTIRKHLRTAAQNTAETFARLLNDSFAGAVSGDAMKSGLEAYQKNLIETSEGRSFLGKGGTKARAEALQKLKVQRQKEEQQADARLQRLKDKAEKMRGLGTGAKNRGERIKKAEDALNQAKADRKKMSKLADAREKALSQSPAQAMKAGQTQMVNNYAKELRAANNLFGQGAKNISDVNARFAKLRDLAEQGIFDKKTMRRAEKNGVSLQAQFVKDNVVKNVVQNSTMQKDSISLLSESLKQGAVAASTGTAKVNELREAFINLGTTEGYAGATPEEITQLAKDAAAKYGKQLGQVAKLYEEGTMAGDTFRKAIDEANEAALDASEYGVKNFTNSLLGGFLYSSRDFYSDLNSMAKEFSEDFRTGVAGAFGEAIKGTKNLKEAFGDMLAAMADKMLDKTLQMGVNSIFDAVMPSPGGYSKGGAVKGYSTGGMVYGGSGTKDDVPAYLSKGEYVIKRSSVDALGKDFFDSLNSGRITQAATGGMMSKDPKHAVQIAQMRAAEARRRKDLYDAGISQFSYREADPEKKKEDWLGRETSEPVIHTKSDYRVNLKQPINSERLAAIKEVLKRYPDVGKNMDREMFDDTSVEIGSGKYKAHLKNKFIFDNLKRPENAIHLQDSRLSANALTDENNPQNRYKFEKMDAFFGYQHERMQHLKDQQEAMEKHERQKQGRRYGFLFGGASLLLSSALAGGRGMKLFAKGGKTGDDIPALLTGGEYVVRKDIVDRYGTSFFDRLNSGNIAAYATGGLVTRPHTMSPVGSTTQGKKAGLSEGGRSIDQTNNINITVNVDAAGNVNESGVESTQTGEGTPLSEGETKELASRIKTQVLSTLVQEKKPGGMLYER